MNSPASADRRQLRFDSIDELLAEVDRIVAADGEGQLETLGSWTPGQILGHVAAWIEYGYDGFPMKPPPWIIRLILRMQVKKYLRRGMPSGVRIPKVPQGTYGIEDMPTEEAAGRLRVAADRLKRGEAAKYDSPAFGPMSREQRVQLNLRHAELHLSFLRY